MQISPLSLGLFGLSLFVLTACGGKGTGQPVNVSRAQSVAMYGEGTEISGVTTQAGQTVQVTVRYHVAAPSAGSSSSDLADQVRFTYNWAVFDQIPNLMIAAEGTGESWTIPVTVKSTVTDGVYPIRATLYRNDGELTSIQTVPINVTVVN